MSNADSSFNQDNYKLENIFRSKFLFDSVHEVMENMAGLSVRETKIQGFNEMSFDNPSVSGVYFMKGPKDAVLILSIPTGAAFTMVSFMSSIPAQELDRDSICDAINELTNMIAGKLKAQLSQKGYKYTSLQSFTIYGQNYSILHKNKLESITKKYETDDMELVLRILFI